LFDALIIFENSHLYHKMKIRVINFIEIILEVIFVTSFAITKLQISDLSVLTFFSGLILGLMYFPIGFYTLKSPGIYVLNTIIYGAIFSLFVISILLNSMGIDLSIVILIITLSLYLCVAIFRVQAVYLIERPILLDYSNSIAIRYLLSFIIMIIILLTYKFR
jgi:hypothetical protein